MRRAPSTWALLVLAATCGLGGCVTDRPAPVVDRSLGLAAREPQEPPDHYLVQRGDTLYSIAFRYGVDHKTLARWNDIPAPFTIYPGQRLRFGAAPAGETRTRRARTGPAGVRTEPLPQEPDKAPRSEPLREPAEPPAVAQEPPRQPAEREPEPAAEPEPQPVPERLAKAPEWQWPAAGELLSRFSGGDSSRNGIDIGGESGTPVKAAAAGEVVYSGSGLIGYGELIIVKHDNALLSAYGHNRKRLVQEGDRVKAGQQIAEMGQTGAPRPMLHFEIREDGKPIDPMKYLPKR